MFVGNEKKIKKKLKNKNNILSFSEWFDISLICRWHTAASSTARPKEPTIYRSDRIAACNYFSTNIVNLSIIRGKLNMACLKADMNSDILLKTAAIFFSVEYISQTGYWLGLCHCWFHLQGLAWAVKISSRARITKWKIFAHCRIRTRDLPLTKRTRYHWATGTDVCLEDKSSPAFTCAILRNLPVARGRCRKLICRLFLSYNICIVLLFEN